MGQKSVKAGDRSGGGHGGDEEKMEEDEGGHLCEVVIGFCRKQLNS